jgi:PAS domain S-box-containing protein
MKHVDRGVKILLLAAALVLLYLSSLYKYLLFHSLAEVFSICIAMTVFFITWNSRSFLKNNYLTMVGTAYLFIGFLDFLHTLAFKGMPIFSDYDYYANQLWIAARGFESLVLLISFLLIKSKKSVNTTLLVLVYTVITTGVLLSIFVFKIFPIAYVDGYGLTGFKKISELVICAILLAAILILRRYKSFFEDKVYRLVVVSMIFTIITEICFTAYVSNYDFTNLLGHYFKIVSFYFIYKAIIRTGITEPYHLIFREMKQTQQQLYEQNKNLSNQTIADNLTIKEHLQLLQQQYTILNRQSKLLDLSQEAIIAWDLSGTIFYWNKGAELMYGYTPAEATGRVCDELLKTEREYAIEETMRLLERNGKWTGELIHTTKDGRRLCMESARQLYSDEDGRKIVLELCRDVTERNRLEADLRYQNLLFYAIIENMHDAFFIYDRDGTVTSVNARAREMYPNHFSDVTSVTNVFSEYRCLDLDRRPLSPEAYPTRRAFRGELISNERIIMESDGWSRIIEVNATPIVSTQDEVLAIVVCHHDITELIRRQHAIEEHVVQLQQQNKVLNRQAKLLDLSHEAIFAWYLDGPIMYWNQGAERIYGFSDDEAIGCIPYKLLHSRYPFSAEELMSELMKNGGWSGYVEHLTKDGRVLIIETRMQVIVNEHGLNTVLETNRDVTEKIKAENAIQKSTMELKNIINSTDDYIWSVDTEYRIIFCNRAVFDFTRAHYGFDMEPGLPFLEYIPAENASSYREFFEQVKREGEFTVDLHSFRGNKYVSYSFHPVYLDGQLVEITAFGRDITERINTEQEIIRLNASLEARIHERTKELEESLKTNRNLTLMVTHDLKTPLQEISFYAKQLLGSGAVTENAGRISSLCCDMSAMISGLMEYDGLSNAELSKEPVDIKAMIDAVYAELRTENAVLEFQTGIPSVHADPAMLRRVVTNLLSNALKFSAKREKPRIVVGCKKESSDYVFYIKDNGVGIDMAYAGKLFNVFERLHDSSEFEGHGIGLASVRSIISMHGGKTWIQGKPDVGTTVYFTLPDEPFAEACQRSAACTVQ